LIGSADRDHVRASLTVHRWQRYGADRIYVVSPLGAPLGSVDLETGAVDVTEDGDELSVRRAAQAFLRADVTELAVPTQRSGTVGLNEQDEAMLAEWLGAPSAAPPARSRLLAGTPARLDQLGDLGWTVLHDVPIGLQGSVCEHLVVGPPGVLVLSDRGRVDRSVDLDGQVLLVGGDRTSHVRAAVLQARRVAALLRAAGAIEVQVRPVISVAGTFRCSPPRRAAGPLVLPRADLVNGLRALPELLTPGAVSAVARVARRAETWPRGD
jgi:hypothetical protein